jgi:hypothetical protein
MDGAKSITNTGQEKLAPNGRQRTTLRLPIRANPSPRGFAGRRNVVERNERMRVKRNRKSALDSIILCRRKSEPFTG